MQACTRHGRRSRLLGLGRQQVPHRLDRPVLDKLQAVAGAGLEGLHKRGVAAGGGEVSTGETRWRQRARVEKERQQRRAQPSSNSAAAEEHAHRFFTPSSTSQYSRRRSPSRPFSSACSGCCSKNLGRGGQGRGEGKSVSRGGRRMSTGGRQQRAAAHEQEQPPLTGSPPPHTHTGWLAHLSLRSGSRTTMKSSLSASIAEHTTARAPARRHTSTDAGSRGGRGSRVG